MGRQLEQCRERPRDDKAGADAGLVGDIVGGGVDQEQTCDALRVEVGIGAGDQSAEGVADEDDGTVAGGVGYDRVKFVEVPLEVWRRPRGAGSESGPVVADGATVSG